VARGSGLVGVSIALGVLIALLGPTFGAVGAYSAGTGIERGNTYTFTNHGAHGRFIRNRRGVTVCDVGPDRLDTSYCATSRKKIAEYKIFLAPGYYTKTAYLPVKRSRHLCHAFSPDGPNLISVYIQAQQTIRVDWYCQLARRKT
jgi:hypothetical protein